MTDSGGLILWVLGGVGIILVYAAWTGKTFGDVFYGRLGLSNPTPAKVKP